MPKPCICGHSDNADGCCDSSPECARPAPRAALWEREREALVKRLRSFVETDAADLASGLRRLAEVGEATPYDLQLLAAIASWTAGDLS